jgi:hypothetical protein
MKLRIIATFFACPKEISTRVLLPQEGITIDA